MLGTPQKIFWFICGSALFVIGVIGLLVPIMPQVPFFVGAAFCFARSSQRVHDWIMSHKIFGPIIADWQNSRAISLPVKIWTSLSFIASLAIATVLKLPLWGIALQAAIMFVIAIYIWNRPER